MAQEIVALCLAMVMMFGAGAALSLLFSVIQFRRRQAYEKKILRGVAHRYADLESSLRQDSMNGKNDRNENLKGDAHG